MILVIITHVPHLFLNNHYYGYAPYVREMNVWLKYVSKVIIVAPTELGNPTKIHSPYKHSNIEFVSVESFDIKSMQSKIATVFKLPNLILKIFKACSKANHIHLRCPGNMGLLGSLVQILFPKKAKTAKYAGNWDPKSKQPFTYKLQQKILNNTFLTRNMQVLVYGEWKGTSKNIKSFFTASYSHQEATVTIPKQLTSTIKLVFAGTLVSGKRPLYSIQLLQELLQLSLNVRLDLYGDGNQRDFLKNYVTTNNLQQTVCFHGNQNSETLKNAYQESHFVILPSESEGWPKVIAEGMFWGCVPIATAVSCLPYMLDYGKRGLLLTLDVKEDAQQIQQLINAPASYKAMSEKSENWSRKYTLDYFEQEIQLLLQP